MDKHTTAQKQCSKCGLTFNNTVEFFGPEKRFSDGLRLWCRTCTKMYFRQWRAKNPEKARAIVDKYLRKDLEASRARFRANAARNRARNKTQLLQRQREKRHLNIEKTRAEANAYRRAHPEIFRRAHRAWEEKHPDNQRIRGLKRRQRARHVPRTFTAQAWDFCLRYWHFSCAVCGAQEGFLWKLAMDHWIPLASTDCPGTIAENILVLCHGIGGCNNSKHDNDPLKWLEQKLGKIQAKKKFQEIEHYFAVVRMRQHE